MNYSNVPCPHPLASRRRILKPVGRLAGWMVTLGPTGAWAGVGNKRRAWRPGQVKKLRVGGHWTASAAFLSSFLSWLCSWYLR